MKERKFLTSTLLVAAAMSFGVVSARAGETYTLGDGDTQAGGSGGTGAGYTFDGDTFEISSGTISGSEEWGTEGHKGAWIVWAGNAGNNNGGTLGASGSTTTITGSGFLGLQVRYGGSNCTADLTNVDISGFSGQFCFVNDFAKQVTVKLSGDQWSKVEYIFGSVTLEWAGESGITTGHEENSSPSGNRTLELQGNTTFAGITGTSKGNAYNAYEAITIATTGATLTLVGEGDYEFYGTVGAENLGLSISMGYASGSSGSGDVGGNVGSQTFGGTNYLDNVSVNEGTLKLGGTTSIKGAVTVASGAELDLSGTVTLGSAISNSGTVVVDSSVTFVLDNLTPSGSDNTYTYTIISGGTIEGWGSLDYSNFSGVTSDRQIDISTSGQVTIDTSQSAQNLTWAGSNSGTWNSNVSENTVWTNGGSNDYFVNGDNVTFSSSGSTEITVSGDVKAGTMTVSSGNYTFTASGSDTLTVDSVSVNSSDAITFEGGGEFTITGDYTVEDNGSTQGASLTVGENTSVTMKNYEASWHQGTTTLGTGATLTVTTQMWFHTASTEELTGGTFNIEQLTVSNYASVSIHDTNLNIGAGDSRGGLKADEDGYFIFGDNLTVGVYAGASGTNTGWSTTADIQFTKGEGTGTTFHTEDGQTITLGGSISGVGFTNTGSGTLTLSGAVAFSNAIINSGNIVLDASTVSIAVDGLDMKTYTDEKTSYYEIITGSGSGTVTFDGGSSANFTLEGGTLSSSWNIYTTDGYLVIYRTANDLTWAGTSGNNTWNYEAENWSDGGSATFSEGDNVIFGTDAEYKIVDITESVAPGSITVNDDYTFTTEVEGGVVVDASGDLTVAEGKTLTIGEGVTLYIDEVEENFSVEGKITGSGTIEIDLTSGEGTYGSTINLGTDNGFTGTVYINSGYFHLYGSDIGNGTYRLGDGVNIEIATSGVSVSNNFIIEGTTELHVNANDSLTISGNITGVETNDTMGGSFDRQGAGSLEISGNVDIGTFTIDTTGSGASSTTTFSGSSVKIGALNVVYADSVIFSSTTTTIGSLTFSAAGTVTFNSNATITGNVAFTTASGEALAIGNGATLTVGGNLTSTDTNNSTQVRISLGEGSTLNVANSITFATGQAGSNYSQIAGKGADKSTVIAGAVQVGNDATGGAFEISNVTLITGGISFGSQSGSSYYLYLDNMTLGFSQSTTISPGTAGTTEIVLGEFAGSGGFDSSASTTTTINTGKYDATTGTFSSTEGYTVTISQAIMGNGALVKDGAGSLVLSAANTFSGGLTITSGTVVAQNASALGSGDVSVSGGTLQVDTYVTTSGDVTFSEAGKLIVSQTLLATAGELTECDTAAVAVITANTITFGNVILSEGDVTNNVAEWAAAQSGQYIITGWYYNSGTLYAIVAIPEPSTFGLLFGLSALGLVATRRRRKVA